MSRVKRSRLGREQLLGLALAEVPVGVDVAAVLPLGADHVRAGGLCEAGELGERVFGGPAGVVAGIDGEEECALGGRCDLDDGTGAHGLAVYVQPPAEPARGTCKRAAGTIDEMTNPRNVDDTSLNPPDLAAEQMAREIAGQEVQFDDKDAVLDVDEVDVRTSEVTDTELYEGGSGVMRAGSTTDSPESLELLEDLDLRSDETNDPNLASEEGLAYVPPVDPPVVPSSDPEGVRIAAGFGTSALDTPFEVGHGRELVPGEDEMTDRVREAILADSLTSRYAEALEIETDGGTVWLRGTVDDVDDSDALAEVASRVTGVVEVIDETELAQ